MTKTSKILSPSFSKKEIAFKKKIERLRKMNKIKWSICHLKIINALNKGCRTKHEIFLETDLSYTCIAKHKKRIVKCPRCKTFVNKAVFCQICGFRFVESYG